MEADFEEKLATIRKEIVETHKLTKREAVILKALSEGMTNKDISNAVGITDRTVKTHLYRIYKKCGVSNSRKMISYALTGEK